MQKHLTHVIDKQAVLIFKGSLPEEDWTVYDIQPDYGKDHKVELVEGGAHTGSTFWVQIKGQKKVRRLKDGTITFKLETKDLDYHTKLSAPVFLVVVDVTKREGYWVFLQKYVRTWLRNVPWRDQDHIQIRLPASNTLSKTSLLRQAVREAIRYMTDLSFHSDIGTEQSRLVSLDPRFKVEIMAGTGGRHYHLHSDEVIPIGFSYKEGNSVSGKIEGMLDRGLPIVVRGGEIEISGSPLFDFLFEMAGESEVRLEVNKTVEGFANLLRTDESGNVVASFDGIPCKIVCGRKEARFEAILPTGLLELKTTISYEPTGKRPLSISIHFSAWQGCRLMDLPYFDQLASLFVGIEAMRHRFALECLVPGQRFIVGTMNLEESQLHLAASFLIETLQKARAIAAVRSVNPVLPEKYYSEHSLSETQALHDMLIGEGWRRITPSARVRTVVGRDELRKFLADAENFSSPGILHLYGEGSFSFLGDSIRIDSLQRIFTSMCLVNTRESLQKQLDRSSRQESFRLEWKATEATEMILREGLGDDAQAPAEVSGDRTPLESDQGEAVLKVSRGRRPLSSSPAPK